MQKTKVIVVSHYEHVGTRTDGIDLSKKIENALEEYPSDMWTVRSADTTIHTADNHEGELGADTTYATTIILDRII